MGAGILALQASRKHAAFRRIWLFLAFVIGPIFLFFILPAWLDQWRRPRDPQS